MHVSKKGGSERGGGVKSWHLWGFMNDRRIFGYLERSVRCVKAPVVSMVSDVLRVFLLFEGVEGCSGCLRY